MTLKNTILTAEMSTKVDEADYIYYKVEDGIYPPKEALFYQPSEDDYILDKDSDNWQRLIFPLEGPYNDFEEEKYEELEEYIDENEIIVPKNVSKSDFMRFLQANHYKVDKAVEDILNHLNWKKATLPIILTDVQKMILDEGLFYIHGRDRNFRPLNIFDPRIIIGKKADRDEVIMIVHFVLQYLINNMMVPGRVENWVGLLDLSGLSLSELPKKWMNEFIKS